MKRLDIVLLQCGLPEMTVRCINSIRATFEDCRIILVDNCSSAYDLGTAAEKLGDCDTLISLPENRGFAKAMNIGIRHSNAPYVCILNNDTVIADGALERMLDYMDALPDVGLIGPRTNRCNTMQRSDGPGEPGVIFTNGLVAFFCTIIRREVLDQVGLLSEEFGLGYGEDDDYCIRVRQAGWQLGIASDAWVEHEHHATYRVTIGDAGIEREGQQGLALLREKYG